jgi:hypothetical protein
MHDLGPLPRQHPRTLMVKQAGRELSDCVLRLLQQYDLTYTEILQLLNEEQARLLKSALRAERHPQDPGEPADLE